MVSMERRRPHYLLPLLLIVVGLVALLVNLDLVSGGFWDRLFMLWPLVLVVIGLEFLTADDRAGRTARVAAFGAVLVIAAGATLYAIAGPAISGGLPSGTSSAPMGQISSANLELSYGAGTVNLTTADLGSDLYRASYSSKGVAPSRTFDLNGSTLTVKVNNNFPGSWFGGSDRLDLTLNSSIPWAVTVNAGGFTGDLDLRSVDLRSLDVNAAAGKVTLQLGSPTSSIPVQFSGVAQQLTVKVPSGTAIAVHASGIASNVTLPDGQSLSGAFSDKSWQSANYAGAAASYDVEVSGVADQLTVEVS